MTEPDGNKPLRGFNDYEIRLGDDMRGRRATMGKSFMDVERELHIRAHLIDAIERADIDRIEAKFIIPGHVRTYAKYLGMNPEEAYQRFCDESGFVAQPGTVRAAEEKNSDKTKTFVHALRYSIRGQGKMYRGVTSVVDSEKRFFQTFSSSILILGLTAGIGYVLWTVYDEIREARQSVYLAPESPSDETRLPAQSPLLTNSGSLETSIGDTVSRLDEQRIGNLNPRDFSIYSEIGQPSVQTSERVQDLAATTARVETDKIPTLAIVPSRSAWIRVTAADGSVVKEGTLLAGDEYHIPPSETGLSLRAGNSGSIYFLVDGELYGPAGQGTSVINNIRLTTAAIKTTLNPIIGEIPRDLVDIGWNVFKAE